MKKLIFPLVSFLILFPTTMVLLAYIASGKVNLGYQGFAVDKYGNVYLGKNSRIDVYNGNGDFLRSLDSQTNRGYGLTILKGDKVFVDTGDYYYLMDLDGNVLQETDVTTLDDIPYLGFIYNQTRFTADDGSEYRMLRTFGGVKIIRIKDDNITVALDYSEPVKDTVIIVAFGISFILIMVTAAYCVLNGRKLLGFKDYERGNEQNA